MAESEPRDSVSSPKFTAEKFVKEQASMKSDLRLARSKLTKSLDQILAFKEKLQNAFDENAKPAHGERMKSFGEGWSPSTKSLCDQLTETLKHLASQIQQAVKDKERFEFKFSTSVDAINSLKQQMKDLSVKLSASEENIKSQEKELEELQLEKGQKEKSYQNEQCRTSSFSNEKDAMIKNSEATIAKEKLNIENLNFQIEKVRLELASKEAEGKYIVGVKEKLEQENMNIQLTADNLSEYIEAMIRHCRDIIKDDKVTETIASNNEYSLLCDDFPIYSSGEEGDTSGDDDYDDDDDENSKKGIDDQCEERAWKSAHLRSVSSSSFGAEKDSSDTDTEGYRGNTRCPKRSEILAILLACHPDNIANNTPLPPTLPSRISLYYAEMCLSKERFDLLKESKPQGKIGISDTKGRLHLFWKPRPLDRKHIAKKRQMERRTVVAGSIRDQLFHGLCWAYSLCDMVSASLVLHGWEKEFTPLCPRYLYENVRPDLYGKELKEGADLRNITVHSCYGLSLEDGLAYVQDSGIPKEMDPVFNCNVKRASDPGEKMYHITDVFKYETMEQALVRLKSHPVAAKLTLFDGWKSDRIYRGPIKKGAEYKGEHEVLMLDCLLVDGEMVIRCKSSNGGRDGVSGYIYVSLEVMFLLAGKDDGIFCFKKPQYLLSDFFSIGMETGPLGLQFKEMPNRKKRNYKKFKVILKQTTTDSSESSENNCKSALNLRLAGIEDTAEHLETQLTSEISNMSLEKALTLARAFSHVLNLMGIAETHHRVRRVRNLPQLSRSCNDVFSSNLLQSGVSPDELYDTVCKQGVEIDLTAHPTQVNQRILQHKHIRMAHLLEYNDRPDLGFGDRETVIEDLLLKTRRLLELLLEGLPCEYDPWDYYETPDQLLEPLLVCYESLHSSDSEVLADGRLADLIRRVATFGMVLMKLDLRQEAAKHSEALDVITTYLDMGTYSEWDEEKKLVFLTRELKGRRPLAPPNIEVGPEVKEVLDTFRVAAELGSESLGAYVISMASNASDVLAVELVQKDARLAVSGELGRPCPAGTLRVVPLFETVKDLRGAGSVIRKLLSIEWYREHMEKNHSGHQEVIVGYSDSGKDAGRFTAAWEQHKAQEVVVGACNEFGIKVSSSH
ncbi:unnamed protein product [Eruca vesicaria subsp. sativa]|uniref:Peptidase C1A papain C-terminal domain-containing protein n=1 Tax=Eruca vesicaria subsp. sativa TaxID=29727 RepID=A0ABC8M4Z7_ERUVS|nr:unnamed protein product [Eruca vesicaria subsp. sativa]